MQKYINTLQEYCKQNPLNHGDAESVMNLLYWTYSEYNPIDNQEVRDGFAELRNQFPNLSLQEFDPAFTLVSDLRGEHAQVVFYEGLRLDVGYAM